MLISARRCPARHLSRVDANHGRGHLVLIREIATVQSTRALTKLERQPQTRRRAATPCAAALALGATGCLLIGMIAVARPASAAAGTCADTQIVTPTDGTGIFTLAGHEQCRPGSSAEASTEAAPGACTYKLVSTVPAWAGEVAGQLSGDPLPRQDSHIWYEQSCPGGRSLIAVPTRSGLVEGAVVSPEELAIWARNRMRLPEPAVSFNPRVPSEVGPATFVGLPTWWWVSNWSARSQYTSAGPVWVEVSATPVRSSWDPGDGGRSVACDGGGLRWSPAASEGDPRACIYTYGRSSATEPGRLYTAVVTATWRVRWTGSGGTSGVLPDFTTSSRVQVPVQELQTIVTGGR